MTPGSSKLLINESVVPDFGADLANDLNGPADDGLGRRQRADREAVARALPASRVANHRNRDL